MYWAIDLDDYSGNHCGLGRYPLLNAVKAALKGGVPPTFPPTRPPRTGGPTTHRPVPPNTHKPKPTTSGGAGGGGGGKCKAIGAWKGNANMDAWCVDNCAKKFCPSNICICS